MATFALPHIPPRPQSARPLSTHHDGQRHKEKEEEDDSSYLAELPLVSASVKLELTDTQKKEMEGMKHWSAI
jgi:hypothetical protein